MRIFTLLFSLGVVATIGNASGAKLSPKLVTSTFVRKTLAGLIVPHKYETSFTVPLNIKSTYAELDASDRLAFLDKLRDVLATDMPIMDRYLDLLLTEGVNIQDATALAKDVHDKMVEVADLYVSNTHRGFYWEWNPISAKNNGERIDYIAHNLLAVKEYTEELYAQKNDDVGITQILSELLSRGKYTKEKEEIESLIALYREIPAIEVNFSKNEAAELFDYVENNNPSLADFDYKMSNMLLSSERFKVVDVSLQSELSFSHIIDSSVADSITDFTKVTEFNQYITGKEAGFFFEVMLIALVRKITQTSFLLRYGITWKDLMDGKYLVFATGEFLATMGWGWQDLGEIVYPHDVDKAAKFIEDSVDLEDIEKMVDVLRPMREKAGMEDRGIIDKFLEELPYLKRKNKAISDIMTLMQANKLTTDKEKTVSLGGRSPREIIDEMLVELYLNTVKWGYIASVDLARDRDDLSYYASFSLARMLRKAGMSENDLQERVFTKEAYSKWINGTRVTEQDLHGIRKLLSAKDNVNKIRDYVGSKQGRDSDLTPASVSQALSNLPYTLQKEGFMLEFAQDTGNSYKKLQRNLRNVQEESEYRLLARAVLNMVGHGGKNRAAKLMRNIGVIRKEMSVERDLFINAYHPELRDNVKGISAVKQKQVEARKREKIQKQKEKKHEEKKAQREITVRSTQRKRTEVQARQAIKAKQHKEKQQRRILQSANEVQEGRIKELAKQMAGGKKISADTPISLRIIALVEFIHLKTNMSAIDHIHLKEIVADTKLTEAKLVVIESFFLRSAERLRHKGNRAKLVTIVKAQIQEIRTLLSS